MINLTYPMGTNTLVLVSDDQLGFRVWFSYGNPIAFQTPSMTRPVCRENEWSTAVARHLNAINREDARLSKADFIEAFKQAVDLHTP